MFRNALIIGLGLMGGSVALALKQKKLAESISGYDIVEAMMDKALRSAMIHKKAGDLTAAVADADLVVVCSHLAAYKEIGNAISRFPKADAVITDVGSVKAPAFLLASFLTSEQKHNFVSSHPVAGSENSGISGARADLFERRKVIITPLSNTKPRTVQAVAKMWKELGGETEVMVAEAHDAIYAGVSHVPQFLSWCYADFLSRVGKLIENPEENFTRFTRIAASNPALWQDIFLANNKNISSVIADFYLNFSNIMREVESPQKAELQERFARAINDRKALKDEYSGYRETPWAAADFDATVMVPRVIALALLEVTADMKYAGPGFLDFSRQIISDPERTSGYLVGKRREILPLLQDFFDCMDNFYKIVERNTKPDILLKMAESRNNYLKCVGKNPL